MLVKPRSLERQNKQKVMHTPKHTQNATWKPLLPFSSRFSGDYFAAPGILVSICIDNNCYHKAHATMLAFPIATKCASYLHY